MKFSTLLRIGGGLLVAWILVLVLRPYATQVVLHNDWNRWGQRLFAIYCLFAITTTLSTGIYFYLVVGFHHQLENQSLLKRYPGVYRLTANQTKRIVLLAPNAMILEGDYGWQAESVQPDELIYMHGLNEDWNIVWYAGFATNEIELVSTKPENQYCRVDWQKNKSKCPFVVQSKVPNIKSFGLARTMIGRWIQGVLVPLERSHQPSVSSGKAPA